MVTSRDSVFGGHRGVPEDAADGRRRMVVRERNARDATHAQDSMEFTMRRTRPSSGPTVLATAQISGRPRTTPPSGCDLESQTVSMTHLTFNHIHSFG